MAKAKKSSKSKSKSSSKKRVTRRMPARDSKGRFKKRR